MAAVRTVPSMAGEQDEKWHQADGRFGFEIVAH